MSDGAEQTNGGSSAGSGKVVLNVWTAIVIAILMGTLVAIIALVIDKYSAQEAGSILGIIIPGFISIGTAAFGIAVASNAASGRADAEAGKATAEAERLLAEQTKTHEAAVSRNAARAAIDHIDGIEAALERIVEPIKEGLSSPAGEADYLIAPEVASGQRLTIGSDDIESAETRIAAARASLEASLQQGS